MDNLVSQLSDANLSTYKRIENQWDSALRNGKQVTVDINVNYDRAHLRPVSFEVTYTIDGERFNRKLRN